MTIERGDYEGTGIFTRERETRNEFLRGNDKNYEGTRDEGTGNKLVKS